MMKKRILAMLLLLSMVCLLFAACGSTAEPASAQQSAASEAAAAEETESDGAAGTPETPETPDAPETDALSAEEAEESDGEPLELVKPHVEHRASMPGAEKAELDFINTVSLPLTDGAELTMLTPAVNLMGDLANLGIENYNGFDYMKELEQRTGVHVETAEVNFFTASEQYNVIIASGDYPDLFKNIGT